MRDDAPALVIRAASPDDATALARLTGELGYDVTPDEVAERLAGLPAADEVAVALVDDLVVGWMHLSESRTIVAPGRVAILGLVVSADARRHRVGRRMIEHAAAWGRRRGLPAIYLRSAVRPGREAAHAFYPAVGFRELKRQVVYVKDVGSATGRDRERSAPDR